MGARRQLAFSDFLFSEELPPENFDLWTATSSPSRKPTTYTESETLPATWKEVQERGFLGGFGGHFSHLSLPPAPGWRTILVLSAGAVAAGGAAFFLLQPGPGAATAAEPAPAAAAAAQPAAPAEAPAAAEPNAEALLQELAQLRADLQGMVGDGPEDRQRRAELQARLAAVEQQLEAIHGEMLAGRTLRQLAAVDAARRSSAEANSFLRMIYDKIAPAFAQLEAFRRVIDQRMSTVSTRVPQLISEEVEGATDDIKSLFQSVLPVPRFNIAEQLPPMTMLLAGLLAPVQLRLMWGDNLVRLALSGVILSMDVISLVLAHGTRCMTQQLPLLGTVDALHIWIGVDALSLALTVAVSAMVVQKAGKTIAEVDAAAEISLETDPGIDPEAAFRMNMEKQLLAGAQAIIMYDALAGNPLVRLPPVLSLFDFFWQASGLFLIFDTPGASCGARFLLDWSRGRAVIFLIGLVPMIVGVGIAAVRLAVSSPGFSQAVLEAAASIDEASFPQGPPVCTIIVRSFVVRDATDVAGVKLQVAKAEEAKLLRARDKVQAERDEAETRLTSTQAQLDAAMAQIAEQEQAIAQSRPEAEFLNQYRRAVAEAMALSQTAEGLATGDLTGLAEAAAEQLRAAEETIPSTAVVTAGLSEAAASASAAAPAAMPAEEGQDGGDGDADMGGTGGSARQ